MACSHSPRTLRATRPVPALAVALALAFAAMTSACSRASVGSTGTTTSAAPTTASSPSPSRTQLSQAEKDAQAAGQAVVAYLKMNDEFGADFNTNLTRLNEVARDQALAQSRRDLTLKRGQQQRQIGTSVVATPRATYLGRNVYQVKACVDVSKVNVVDKDGKSVVAANRRPRVDYTFKVTKASDGFFVTEDKLQGVPC